MKRLLKLSLLLLMTSSIVTGCGSSSNTSNSSNSSNKSSISEVLEHKLTVIENENCTITLSKELAKRDEIIEVSVTDIVEGYEVHKITANGYKIDNNSFIMPNEDVEVEVFLRQRVTNDNVETVKYNVKTMASEYAVITVDNYYYEPGSEVEINYLCKTDYVLDKFYINDNPIEGTSFIMPDDNVLIRGEFIDVIGDTEWQLSCTCSYMTANSFWYFEYAENGLKINVKVKDNRVCGKEFVLPNNAGNPVAFSDNVEIIIGEKNNTNGYVPNETLKVLVDYAGNSQVRIANSNSGWGDLLTYPTSDYNATSEIKTLENKDGYNGYEVSIFISYILLNLEKSAALNNLTACIAMRNTNTYGGGGSTWNCYNNDINIWNNCSMQPVILENNVLQKR